jgi:hypothetical protein
VLHEYLLAHEGSGLPVEGLLAEVVISPVHRAWLNDYSRALEISSFLPGY